MEHHGKNSLCCGCNAVSTAFETGDKVTVARLKEAEASGADILIDICHNCHWIFKPAQKNHPECDQNLKIVNYSAYIAGALGKGRPDSLD
jgi:heterodisulfide reductase subunit B